MKTALIHIEEGPGPNTFGVRIFVEGQTAGVADKQYGELGQIDLSRLPGGVEAMRESVIDIETESDEFHKIGRSLYRMLFESEGTIGALYEAIRLEALDVGLRTRLQIDNEDVRRLPWELMRGPDPATPVFVDGTNPWSRWVAVPKPREPNLKAGEPLRLLIVLAAREQDVALPDDEAVGVRRAFEKYHGSLEPYILIRPSVEEIREKLVLFEPHIVHFAGHGIADGRSALVVQGDEKKDDGEWDITTIVADLKRWTPDLVVLNACRTAGGAASARDVQQAVLGIADALATDVRVPAVVGMQADISSTAAVRFATSLYNYLAESDLDAAVAQARLDLGSSGWNVRDWALPSLTLTTPSPVARPALGYKNPKFNKLVRFVDRTDERHGLAEQLAPHDRPPAPLTLVVANEPGTGTSDLVLWGARACVLRGLSVGYVNLSAQHNLKFHEVLELMCSDLPEVNAWFASDPPLLPDDATQLGLGAGKGLRAATERKRLVTEFRHRLLERLEPDRHYVLIVDHVGQVAPEEFQTTIWPHLVVPLMDRSPVSVVLVGTVNDLERRVPDFRNAGVVINVEEFPARLWRPLLRQFICHLAERKPLDKSTKKFIDDYEPSGTWKAEKLELLSRLLELA